MKDVNDLYNELIELDYFTNDELDLITSINGWSIETLNDCIYARYGYHSLEQMNGEDEE
jgi:hypothetical protein